MTDVIKIALDRRAQLSAELSRLDDFIRMAESLVQEQTSRDGSGPAPLSGSGTPPPPPADVDTAGSDDGSRPSSRPMVFRQKSAG
ncbi:MAG: hypothetical protein AAGD47_04115 [Pseudomonadota bacterium]